jgi:hypothetical protein
MFQRSLTLAKASWGVLRQDKELVLLPLISFAAWIAVAVTFLLPIALVANDAGQQDSWTQNPVTWVLAFAFYVAASYVMIFFNAAIVSGADQRMRGGDPTLGSAIRGAADRAVVLLPWAIVSATVSLILRAIEERAGIVGRIIAGVIGLAWSLVTFLVIPILVIEGISVGQAVKRSMSLFKGVWGEQVVTNGGISLVSFAAIVVGVLVALPFFALGGIFAFVGIAALVAWVGFVLCFSAALSGVFQLALYRYAVDGRVPGFDEDLMRNAFRPRGNRGGWLN